MIVTITEPKIKIVQIGQEVTLRCNVDTQGQVRQHLKLTNIFKKSKLLWLRIAFLVFKLNYGPTNNNRLS